MTRGEAFERLKVLVRARQILRAEGAAIGSVHTRGIVDAHVAKVAARLRDLCRPSIVGNL